MAAGQRWRQGNLNWISSRISCCAAKTETPLSLLCSVFQTVSSSVLCVALNAGSSSPSQPFRLYLQKHQHKNIFIVHSICPAMTPHKTSMLKIWGGNTLDSRLQTFREVVLSMCLIKSSYAYIYLFRAIFRPPTSDVAACKKPDSSSSWVRLPKLGSPFLYTMGRNGQSPLDFWKSGSSPLAPKSTKGPQQDETVIPEIGSS